MATSQTQPPPPSGEFRHCRTSFFGFYWTWNLSTGLRSCLGNHWIKKFRALEYEIGNHWIQKLEKIGRCQYNKEQNCPVVREDVLCIHGSMLKSLLCRFALANLPKTKILAASCKHILATSHFRFCEAMESKIPRFSDQQKNKKLISNFSAFQFLRSKVR